MTAAVNMVRNKSLKDEELETKKKTQRQGSAEKQQENTLSEI